MGQYNQPSMDLEYKELNLHDHTLKRPDTYIGSIRDTTETVYIALDGSIVSKEITYTPAILRLFVEALSNAIDNSFRSKEAGVPTKTIKITVNAETGRTSIWNDGLTIPVGIHEETGIHIPELLFGRLLTSSNYNDTEKRATSGRNGLGISLTNVFSSSFEVEVCTPPHIYRQSWSCNMKQSTKPKITSTKKPLGYTMVTWTPDFEYFKKKGYGSEFIPLTMRYAYDTAMLAEGVSVFFNKKKIPVKTFKDYGKLYSIQSTKPIVLSQEGVECIILPSTAYEVVSFVNGIYTKKGGVHVDPWVKHTFKHVVDHLNKKSSGYKFTQKDIKPYFKFIVKANLPNPEFSSQSKNRLTAPVPNVSVSLKDIKPVLRWGFIEDMKRLEKNKDKQILQNSQRKKRGYVRIEKFDPANKAGGKHSKKCSLILCEGDSAKTYAVTGINVGCTVNGEHLKGRDWFGILPLKGKMLNVRNVSTARIAANKEVCNIVQALGLEFGKVYTKSSIHELRYGRIIALCDQDVDGFHILGLIINLFECLFPSLLHIPGFITWMNTPIMKVSKGPSSIRFYNLEDARAYIASSKKPVTVKYYKGLGTSNDQDIRETFGTKLVDFKLDDEYKTTLQLAFDQKQADGRKTWMTEYKQHTHVDDTSISVSDFINHKFIQFSLDDCKRSLPHLMDGLKESQRKIMYAVYKKNPVTSIKVAQLAGYTSEVSNYHHGEASLCDTITRMAQSFTGSNNLPLLYDDGQFGSRLMMGKDAASPRYIFTKLNPLMTSIFIKEDKPILHYLSDEGETIEPSYYVPIIPMLLVNGSSGVGTGWSCDVPNCNPKDLIRWIRNWLVKEPNEPLIPWYSGFKGTITPSGKGKYTVRGCMERSGSKVMITEIPITQSIDSYKEMLEKLIESRRIQSFINKSDKYNANFIITENTHEPLTEKELKLSADIHTNNIVLFNERGSLEPYDNLESVANSFCTTRLEKYKDRITHILKSKKQENNLNRCKLAFLELVDNNSIRISSMTEKEIIADLKDRGMIQYEKSYNYLLSIPIRNFGKECMDKLRGTIRGIEAQIQYYETVTPETIWLSELQALEEQLI